MQMLSAILAPVANPVSQGAQPAAAAEAAVDFGALLNGIQQETTPEPTLQAEQRPVAADFPSGAVPDAGSHGFRKNPTGTSSDNDQRLSQALPAQARTNKQPPSPESAGEMAFGLFPPSPAPAPTATLPEEEAWTATKNGDPERLHLPEGQTLAPTWVENNYPAPDVATAPPTADQSFSTLDESHSMPSIPAVAEVRPRAAEPIAAPAIGPPSATTESTTESTTEATASTTSTTPPTAPSLAEGRSGAAMGATAQHWPTSRAAGAVAAPPAFQDQAAGTKQAAALESSGSNSRPVAPQSVGLSDTGSASSRDTSVTHLHTDASPAAPQTTAAEPPPAVMTIMVNNPAPSQPARPGTRPSELSETRFEQLLQVSRPEAARGNSGPAATDLQPSPMFPGSSAAPALMTEAGSLQVSAAMEQELGETTGSVAAASPRGDVAWPLPTGLRQADGPVQTRESVPPPSAGTPFMAEQEILDQVVQRLSLRSFQGGQRLTMDLQPAELGQVHLELIQEQDRIQVRLLAQSSEVQGVLERSLPQLQEALQQQGLRLDSIQIGIDQRQASAHGQQQFQQQFQQQGSAHGQGRGSREQSEGNLQALAPVAAAANPSSTVSGLSLRI